MRKGSAGSLADAAILVGLRSTRPGFGVKWLGEEEAVDFAFQGGPAEACIGNQLRLSDGEVAFWPEWICFRREG